MNETLTLMFSKPLVKRAVRSYFLRKMGLRYFIAMALAMVLLIYELSTGDLSWLVGLLGAIIGFGILFPVVGIIGQTRIGLQKLAEMPDATATMTLTDNGFLIRSAIGSAELNWKSVSEVWQFPDYWVLLSSGHFFMTIPQSGLDDQARDSIRAALARGNVKIA
jgi:hypothetical protein